MGRENFGCGYTRMGWYCLVNRHGHLLGFFVWHFFHPDRPRLSFDSYWAWTVGIGNSTAYWILRHNARNGMRCTLTRTVSCLCILVWCRGPCNWVQCLRKSWTSLAGHRCPLRNWRLRCHPGSCLRQSNGWDFWEWITGISVGSMTMSFKGSVESVWLTVDT